jgi:Abortive infection alpha
VTAAKAVNLVLAPIRGLVWGWEKIEEIIFPELARRFEQKLQQLVTPKTTVAGPALQALRFAGDEAPLCEMFVNLLTTAMDKETALHAHPAFVEVIKQLSPDEAKVLQFLALVNQVPLVRVTRAIAPSYSFYTVAVPWFSPINKNVSCAHPELIASYLDNICRLGLASIPHLMVMSTAEAYQALEEDPAIRTTMTNISETSADRPEVERGYLLRTDFGGQFCRACVTTPAQLPIP